MCCKYCNKKYKDNNKKNVEKHEIYCLLNPNRILYKCNICNIEYDKRHQLIGHKKSCGKPKKIKELKIIKEYKCKYCNIILENKEKLGAHILHCKSNPNYANNLEKIKNGRKLRIGHKLSDETKNKISKARTKYLLENPDKVPYKLNHNSKISYPEKTMIKYLNEFNINGWIHQMQFSIYEIDFAFPEYKLAVEIDGHTHTLPKVIEKDIRKDKFLNDNGWKVLRITAIDVKNNVYECINKIQSQLGNKLINIPIEFLNKQYIKQTKIDKLNQIKIEKKKEKQELYNKRILLIKNADIKPDTINYYKKIGELLNMSDNGAKKFMKKYYI